MKKKTFENMLQYTKLQKIMNHHMDIMCAIVAMLRSETEKSCRGFSEDIARRIAIWHSE